MLRKYLFMTAIAAAAATAGVNAQTPQQPPAPAEPQAQASAPSGTETTLTGCVYREADLSAKADPSAKADMDDFVLAEISPSAAGESSTAGAVGTSGSVGRIYKLDDTDKAGVAGLVGKRVEVKGKIDSDAKASAHAEFDVASAREVPGSCPAAPGAAR